MIHYVQNGFRTNTEAGHMLDTMYGWHMNDCEMLVYNDKEKTLVMYFEDDVEWCVDHYDINADMHSYQQSL